MRISLNEIKKLVPAAAKVETDELVKLIGARLVEIEETIDLSEKYKNIFIVKVVECEAIPDTHLHLCQIDTGAKKVQVVCGAPNVHAGMSAVWVAPGAIVPQTFGGENFMLDVRKLRGYESHGMLAGLDELDLGDDHSGIVEADPKFEPGTPFAEAYDLNDIILDIENKSLTHRPDCFGLIGFAREVSGILDEPFHYDNYEAWAAEYTRIFEDYMRSSEKGASIKVSIDPAICPSYHAFVFDYDVHPANKTRLNPDDIFLAKFGMHRISPIVDMTNVIMLLTGQPLHAFDYDKFVSVGGTSGAEIGVRLANKGEKLTLLDDKEIELTDRDIIITSNDVPVALAGAMGGKSTEIDDSTSRIIIEMASFSLFNLRQTQMAHGIFSEAITRFTKGRPVGELERVKCLVVASFVKLGGKLVGVGSETDPSVFDGDAIKQDVVEITTDEINDLLGTNYSAKEIIKTLTNVEFEVDSGDEALTVTAPVWRTDIHIKEDIIEEVGRLRGFDNIPLDFPKRPFVGAEENPLLILKSKIRDILSGRVAAHEILTYTFVSRKLQEQALEDPEDSYKIVNSISPELQCFRQSLVPSLLEKVRDNQKAGYQDFAVYEFNQVTRKSLGLDKDKVPVLKNHLAFAVTGDFYAVRAALVALLHDLGIRTVEFAPLKDTATAPYLEPLHSAMVSGIVVGEIKSTVAKKFKLTGPVAVFELDLDELLASIPSAAKSMPKLSRFPSVERDLTLKVAGDLEFASVLEPISRIFKENSLILELIPVSIYQKKGLKTKNLTFHLRFMSDERTLESSEISDIMEQVKKSVKKAVGADVV
ncbi:phenylalanine--tRNA ligase subunit beta [Candidatus Saccharibacteria bacterium]|nr:phenylalanine--tRNA ligase subunit beta [Candidatus Saccharibacteria bacterium]